MAVSASIRKNERNLDVVGKELLDEIEELQTNFNLLLAKLDDDAGVTDVNYESTLEV